MEKFKKYFSTKGYGFYLILTTILVALITMIVFFVGLGEGFLSWFSFGFLVALVLGDIALIALKKDNFIPALNTICSGVALAFFIDACYSYVVTVMTGIDIETFSINWILTVILSVLLFALSAATIFLPLTKANETEQPLE